MGNTDHRRDSGERYYTDAGIRYGASGRPAEDAEEESHGDREFEDREFENVSYVRRSFGKGSVRRDSGNYRYGESVDDGDDGQEVRYDRRRYTSGVSDSRYAAGRSRSVGGGRSRVTGARASGAAKARGGVSRTYREAPSFGNNRYSGEGRKGRRQGRGGRHFRWQWLLPVLLLVILAGVFGFRLYEERYGYSDETADLAGYFSLSGETDVAVIYQDALYETHARLLDGTFYLSCDMVRELLNKRFYYGESDGLLLYARPTELVQTAVGSSEWSSVSDGTVTESYQPARIEDGTLYLALDYIKKFTDFTAETFTEPNRMVLRTEDEEKTAATIARDTNIRIAGGVKSEILTPAEAGETVFILEKMQEWTKILTEDGYIGYVENRFLEDERQMTAAVPTGAEAAEEPAPGAGLDGKVSMGWHSVISADGNATLPDVTAAARGLRVIAPTWYPLLDDSGNIASYATQSYVEQAHAMGLKVWPVVDNFNTEGVDHNRFLTTLASRQNMISQLMREAEVYGFDGLNVDFELINPENGDDFIEFVRELSIACRSRGLTLSVDNYVTYDFNDYYSMDEQAAFVDYVIVMGYDEHYAGSSEAGSVASIDYVRYGIQRALQEVPASKLINAVPFYTRLWQTDAEGLTSKALGMRQAQEFIAAHGAEQVWDDASGQNYVDFTENGARYQMWVEDARSIASKLEIMTADGIAGVAAWRLGYETADVWDAVAQYMDG
ncbi:glycosyl hydrolase family 18 protein [Lachnoclostridium sp. Marseille-P6806]|uniref:glycosyl hydrolase family 18 protein n=1 Tax=Lachnoclostridium sp. Marseille-P6806 TaxID=2364793 RepID=UPI0013EEFC3D|nr:glycosyl hydrolase family 18 protein [Lachnoclostridium sp. Marseille-P6806]